MIYEYIADDDDVDIAPSASRLKRFWNPCHAFSLTSTCHQIRNECLPVLVRRKTDIKFVLPLKSRGSMRFSPDSFSQVKAFLNSLHGADRRTFLSKPLHFVGSRKGDGHLAKSVLQLFPNIHYFYMDLEYGTGSRVNLYTPSDRVERIRRDLQYSSLKPGHWVDTKLDDIRVGKGLYLHKVRFERFEERETRRT